MPHDMLAARWGGGAPWQRGGAPLAEFLPSLALDHLAGRVRSQPGFGSGRRFGRRCWVQRLDRPVRQVPDPVGQPRCAACPHPALGRTPMCRPSLHWAPLPCSQHTTARLLSAMRVTALLHTPSCAPTGAEAAPAAAATAPAGELRAALRDVVAAQRAQQASAEPARPAARPRLRNSRCAGGAGAATASELGVRCSAIRSLNITSFAAYAARLGVAAGAQQCVPPSCLAAWHARRNNPPLARGQAAAQPARGAPQAAPAVPAAAAGGGRPAGPGRRGGGDVPGGAVRGARNPTLDPAAAPRCPVLVIPLTVQSVGWHPCWPWSHDQPQ